MDAWGNMRLGNTSGLNSLDEGQRQRPDVKLTELPVSLIPSYAFPPGILVLDSKAYLKVKTIQFSTVGKFKWPN